MRQLQSLLLALQSWCNMWELKLNIEKSNVIHFRNPRKQRTNFIFKYNESEILKFSNYKYLGLHKYLVCTNSAPCQLYLVILDGYLADIDVRPSLKKCQLGVTSVIKK